MAQRARTATVRWAVGLLLLLQAALLGWSGYRHTPVIDELAHLPAGMLVWQHGRFDLYRVNPPLVKTIAAAPVVLAEARRDWARFTPHPVLRTQWKIGRDFVRANGQRSFWYFALARWAVIPLILAGGWFCYLWARDLYGQPAGLAALVLWTFSPTVLGNGALITPDAAAAAMGIGAAYTFWRWLRQPSWARAFAAGLMLGLAELAKMTWVILFGLWPLLWLVWIVSSGIKWRAGRGGAPAGGDPEADASGSAHAISLLDATGSPRRPLFGQLAVILLLGLYLLNLAYGFDGSLTPLKQYRFVSKLLGGEEAYFTTGDPGGNRFDETWLGAVPVPLPKDYLLGVDIQRRDFEQKQPCYLRGQWKEGGWWYWYLYALAVKVPLGVWGLVALSAWYALRSGETAWRDELILLAVPLAVLVLLISQTGITRFFRYALPMLPFVFVWASGSIRGWPGRHQVARGLAVAGSGWVVLSSMLVYPHSLSYFNELAGGPRGGHEHLADANIDWGQDYIYLKEWLREHPEARPFHLTGYGGFDPRELGIQYRSVPRDPRRYQFLQQADLDQYGPRPGWYAISAQQLRHISGIYDYFHEFYQPAATAGYSIYIYHITLEEANRVRREMGLPEVQE